MPTIKIGPKNWGRKAGEQWGLRPQGFDASGKLRAELHPLLCGGTTAPTCCCFFLRISSGTRQQQSRLVRRSAAQVPRARSRVRLLRRRPQAEAADLTNRREPLPWDGPTRAQVHRCGATPGSCRQGERAHNFGSPTSTPSSSLSISNLLRTLFHHSFFCQKGSSSPYDTVSI